MLQLVIFFFIAKIFNSIDNTTNKLAVLSKIKKLNNRLSQSHKIESNYKKNLKSSHIKKYNSPQLDCIEKYNFDEVRSYNPYAPISNDNYKDIGVMNSYNCYNNFSYSQKSNIDNNTQQTNQKNSLKDVVCAFCFKKKLRDLFYEKNSDQLNQKSKSLLLNNDKLKIFLFILHSSNDLRSDTELAIKFRLKKIVILQPYKMQNILIFTNRLKIYF